MNLYNSLSRKIEILKPLKNKSVSIYTCGPTVYSYAHIGNMRAYVVSDLLQRAFRNFGYTPKWVMNITDVDDKTIKGSREKYPHADPLGALTKFTRTYENLFFEDLIKLNIDRKSFYKNPRATEHVVEMKKIITSLLKKKIAYEKDGSIYFSISEYQKQGNIYGVLSKLDLSKLRSTSRIHADEYEKENVQDFALWKKSEVGEPSWDFKLGSKNYKGRPGWHIECSAMSVKYLGQPFDIHTGGVDHIFPHHEDEIAQTKGATGKDLARIFMHEEFMLVDGKKMSKSLGNIYTLDDLEAKGFEPLALRYLFLTAHYRSKLNFTWESLSAAENTLYKLRDSIQRISEINGSNECNLGKYKKNISESFEKDLNIPEVLATINILISEANKLGKKVDGKKISKFINEIDKILGLNLVKNKEKTPSKVQKLIKDRAEARATKDFAKSDALRSQINELGFEVEDTASGQRLIKK